MDELMIQYMKKTGAKPMNKNETIVNPMDEKKNHAPFVLERFKSKIVWDMASSHRHNCHELFFLLSGTRRYFIGHSIYNVKAGDLVIIPQNELHRTTGQTKEHYDRILLYFQDSFAAPFYEAVGRAAFDEFLSLGCVQLPFRQQERIRQLFSKMEEEQVRADSYAALSISNLLSEIIILTLRYGNGCQKSPDGTSNKILEAARYISDNYDHEITLHTASRVACMEATYFSKCFKQLTGFGFHDYLTQIRLKKAEEFLRSSQLSISEIADSCGFLSSNYFGDVFKKYKGISPRTFRKQCQS